MFCDPSSSSSSSSSSNSSSFKTTQEIDQSFSANLESTTTIATATVFFLADASAAAEAAYDASQLTVASATGIGTITTGAAIAAAAGCC
ncbi:Protein of unknown function [Gryllus bimaculatus]|nr:Protein of unknown function [Gryllus bimaculatus]